MTFTQLSKKASGKFLGSWADKAFNFASSFPALKLDLLAAARVFTVDVYNLKSGGSIRRESWTSSICLPASSRVFS